MFRLLDIYVVLTTLTSFSVEELAKKKNVKMAQIAIAWSIKKTTAPIVGSTRLENLKDMIGEWRVSRESTHSNHISPSDAVEIQLTDEEIKYLEEPYQPRAIIGHT